MTLVRGGIPVKPHVQRFADAVVAEFGESLSPGTYNGHSPPEGPTQALDLFTPENSAGYAMQLDICNWIIKNQKRFNVRYCIRHNPNGADWIWNIERAAEGWRAMATNDHRGHVHVTFYADDPGNINPPVPPTPTPKELQHMDFTYIYNGEDYVFLASARYFGKLPFGATLDGLAQHKLLYRIGGTNKDFHTGIVALAEAAGFRGIG